MPSEKVCPRCETVFVAKVNQVFCRTDECLKYPFTCSGCGDTKSSGDFYLDKRRNFPYPICKLCTNLKSKEWAENNPEKRKASALKYSVRYNIERYGITQEEYEEMFDSQQGLCAICGLPEKRVMNGSITKLAIDHDHSSEAIRELLCCRCNGILGLAGDDIDILEKCIDYLRKHGGA